MYDTKQDAGREQHEQDHDDPHDDQQDRNYLLKEQGALRHMRSRAQFLDLFRIS